MLVGFSMNDFSKIISEYKEVGIELVVERIDSAECYRITMDGKELIIPDLILYESSQTELVDYMVNFFTGK